MDNVKKFKLKELFEFKRGTRLIKSELSSDFQYPVISSGVRPMGFYKDWNLDKDNVTIARYGTAGYVAWQAEKIWLTDNAFYLKPKNVDINKKYVYYALKGLQQTIYSFVESGANPKLDVNSIGNIKIPLPPLDIQNQIVGILDQLSSYTAELSAELDARSSQYKYCSQKINDFSDENHILGKFDVEYKTIGEVLSIFSVGYSFNKQDYGDSDLKIVKIGNLVNQRIDLSVKDTKSVKNENIDNVPLKSIISSNEILVSLSGEKAGKSAINNGVKCAVNQRIAILKSNENIVLQKYLAYWIFSDAFYKHCQYLATGPNKNISNEDILNFKVPIPPLDIQNQIVGILDQFDTMIKNIKNGLPRLIELNEKRYKYYLNKLLTFGGQYE